MLALSVGNEVLFTSSLLLIAIGTGGIDKLRISQRRRPVRRVQRTYVA